MPQPKQSIDISAGLVPAQSNQATPDSGVDISAGLVPTDQQSQSQQPQSRGLLSKAWDVLTNPQKRAEFQQQLEPTATDGMADRFAKGAARMFTGAVTTPIDLLRPPQTPEETAAYAGGSTSPVPGSGSLALAFKRGIADPAVDQAQKAKADYDKGGANVVSAGGHALAAALPVVGPIAADIGERAGSGDIAGAFGQGAAAVQMPGIVRDAKALPGAVADGASALNPRGMLAKRMAEVPPGETLSRGDIYNAANQNGVNLDLADATGSGPATAVKKVVERTLGGSNTFDTNTTNNVSALNEWGNSLLNELHDTPLTREQVGNIAKDKLLATQSQMYENAGDLFKQVDKTIGGAKPDIGSVRDIAKQIVDDNKDYYAKHPELQPKQAWKTVEAIASNDGSSATPEGMTWKEFVQAKMPSAINAAGNEASAMKLLQKQWQDLGGAAGKLPAKPVSYTWSDLQKLRSDLMKEVQSPDIVGSRSEGWLKQLESAIGDAMDKSAGKLSPMDQQLYQKANGIWQAMKGTFDNPQHPFYHIVRSLDGTTAGNAAANLKPDFVRQLQGAFGNDFSIYQRDAVARILDPKNSGKFDFKNLSTRLTRADMEKLQSVLRPDQLRKLQELSKTGSLVTNNVNPSGTSDVVIKGGDIANIVHNPVVGAATVAGEYGTAKAMTSPRVTKYLTQPKRGSIANAVRNRP